MYLFAQQDKAEAAFSEAQLLYDNGRVDKAIEYIRPWVTQNNKLRELSKLQRAEFFRLAALCYILTDAPDSAEYFTRAMLKIWPNYTELQASATDLERFRVSLDTLYALPKLQVGFNFGMNYSITRLHKVYSVVQSSYTNQSIAYTGKLGYQLGISAQYNFRKHWGINLGAEYKKLNINYLYFSNTFLMSISIISDGTNPTYF